MSICPIPHSNFLIQSLHAPCFPFFQGKASIQIQKETKFKKITTAITQIRNKQRTSSTKHKQTRTKRNSHFHTPTPSFRPKNSSKVFTHYTPSRSPKNHFSKTQVHLPSNALAFPLKRQRVFPETLRGFRSNPSTFWRQIQLFRPIFPHFLLQIHPNTRFQTGSTPSTSLLKGEIHGYTQKKCEILLFKKKAEFRILNLIFSKKRKTSTK